jgi:hypothetical protein
MKTEKSEIIPKSLGSVCLIISQQAEKLEYLKLQIFVLILISEENIRVVNFNPI